MTALFESLPLALNAAFFFVLAGGICYAGARLSYLIDGIAERTHMARAMAGLILLATATELPEVVTTLTAASQGNAALALNNMFGGIAMQTAILAVADIFAFGYALTALSKTLAPLLQALALITGLGLLLFINLTGDISLFAHLGTASLSLAVLYIGCVIFIHKYANSGAWSAVDVPNLSHSTAENSYHNKYDRYSLRHMILSALGVSGIILVCGVSLTYAAEALAEQTGLGNNFVGVALLAASTSLPELSTSITAVRIGAPAMAIANILGSNMIMIFLLLPADMAYTKGPILNEIGTGAALALVSGLLITAVYAIGLVIRPRKTLFRRLGYDSALVFILYLVSLYVFYTFRNA